MNDAVLLIGSERQNRMLEKLLAEKSLRVSSRSLQSVEPVIVSATALEKAGHYDALIFISRNAVFFGFDSVQHLLDKCGCYAIGPATAGDLNARGTQCVFPRNGSSENLLAMPDFKIQAGQRALIIRGQGGREYLKETLEDRSVMVDYLEVYRRILVPEIPADFQRWVVAQRVGLVVAASGEVLAYLGTLLDNSLLSTLKIVVPSTRVGKIASQLGMREVMVARGAETEALAEAVFDCVVS